jgi:hypothetical protein
MPYKHSQEQIKADAAAGAAGKCPECGAAVDPKDTAGHVAVHWSRYPDFDPNSDAGRRARLVLAIGKAGKDE